ncbi:riboflavin synthase domain-like protein [Neolentinus lepideus HHB14362 ss-1]|uniref:Riboflavin synthase domain-like protein n=1 Tax=Neolentinus lepideus HHB14362 ss-1 TaxID=1314782 RepID=A0A165N820_9AGAM|nr:riboflavin synthase domain-like protein [Neolentinus lepideus HHB14362 ss-1]
MGGVLASVAYLFFWPDKPPGAPTKENAPLSSSYFTPAAITSSETTGPDSKLIELTFPSHLLKSNAKDLSGFHPIWSIYVKDDDIQVERAYTPLEGIDHDGHMKFWIKRYPDGEVGRWLHSKNVGDSLKIRGPVTTWNWKENEWDEVVMISGGTGITPFYQLLHHVFTKEPPISSPKTRFTLLHSSRAPNLLPPSTMLETLKTYTHTQQDRFSLRLFVDSRQRETRSNLIGLPLSEGRIGKIEIQQALGLIPTASESWWWPFGSSSSQPDNSERKVLFLVCGPDQMISAIAGPMGRNLSQGDVGGILGELGYNSEQVWKL